MTPEELFKKMDELGKHEFFIQMADHLSREDYDILDRIHNEERAIIKQLKDDYGIDYYKLKERRNI